MDSHTVLADSDGISTAWRSAVKTLRNVKGHSLYNLIYSINSPSIFDDTDAKIIRKFDEFANRAGSGSSTTVANTIFPLDTYLKYGTHGLFSKYDAEVFPRVKTAWGNYFDRMTRRRDLSGKPMVDSDGVIINPLATLLEKLKRRVRTGSGSRNHYELAVADEAFELTTYLPERDRNYPRGGPCLSHLSFKIDSFNNLRLTAFYRSHYYLEKALGNLVGLARLQTFLANEAGMGVGPLTCIASMATLESSLRGLSAKDVEAFLVSI